MIKLENDRRYLLGERYFAVVRGGTLIHTFCFVQVDSSKFKLFEATSPLNRYSDRLWEMPVLVGDIRVELALSSENYDLYELQDVSLHDIVCDYFKGYFRHES